jgi:hypothetical protein
MSEKDAWLIVDNPFPPWDWIGRGSNDLTERNRLYARLVAVWFIYMLGRDEDVPKTAADMDLVPSPVEAVYRVSTVRDV